MTQLTRVQTPCRSCGYENDPDAFCCSMCGFLIRSEKQVDRAPGLFVREREIDLDVHRSARTLRDDPRILDAASPARTTGLPEPLLYLVLGLVIAPVFGLTPVLGYMGWFFASLVHEMGHSAVAWFFGSPAFPAIRLDGHAVALARPQMLALALVVWAVLALVTWQCRGRRGWLVGLGLITLLYPALAFTRARGLLHLLGGHLGELTISGVFFYRVLAGGFTSSRLERLLYAVVAWYLMAENLLLCGRLLFTASGRAAYQTSGSFGLTNDYIRVARDVLGCSLETVATGMGLACLLVLPLSFLVWRMKKG